MVTATVITPFVQQWWAHSQTIQVLHLFAEACNLINESGQIVSLVTPALGAGPFALVVPVSRPFTACLTVDAQGDICQNLLQIGSLCVDVAPAVVWQPVVDWRKLAEKTAVWQTHLPDIQMLVTQAWQTIGAEPTQVQQRLREGLAAVLAGIGRSDLVYIAAGVKQLAGLGRGLTPAGDDLLMGVMYGLWATEPEAVIRPVLDAIVQTAVPRTTRLSGAWLTAAGHGEAVAAWHELSRQLVLGGEGWRSALQQILKIGHSSGADALWGFTAVVGS